MEAKLCFYICNSLVPEVSHLLQVGNHPDVEVKSFPAVCIGCTLTDERIMDMVSSEIDHFAKIIVIVSSCRGNMNATHINHNKIEIIQLEQCFEILFNLPSIYHFIKQGNYIVSNGWLRNYNHHIREWGFDGQSAKQFFGESMQKILLLETGLPGNYHQNLEALSEYMGLKYDILPIGNSHLQKFIESLIFIWRSENERSKLNERIAKITRESADYTLIFHHLQRLIDHTDEEVIVNDIFALIDLLFAPEQIIYQQIGTNTPICCYKPDVTTFNFDAENSFEVEVKHAKEQIGTFGIIGVKFPEYIPKYQSTTNIISQMGGLAISNARKFAEIEHAKSEIVNSEILFKTMFTGAPIGIALIDSQTGVIQEVNSTFAKITDRTREEIVLIDWMQITHPDDLQKDLDNMELLNAGKISGFQMEKRYLRPNDTYVWINMTIAPIKIEGNARRNHLCMIEDITERKSTIDKLHESEARFKAIMKQSPSPIEMYDLNGMQRSVNQAYEELWGFPASLTVNKFNILESEEVKRTGLYEYVMRAYKGEAVQVPEYQFNPTGKTEAKGKGRERWLSSRIYPLKDSNDQVQNIIVAHEDVTSKKETENILTVTAQRFKKLSESGTEMLKLETPHDIYNYITESLHLEYPESIILFSEIDANESFSNLTCIKGVSEVFIRKSIKLTGYSIFNKKFKLFPRHFAMFKSGKLHAFDGGVAEFSGEEFPPIAAKAIGKLLGIKQIYTIGINKNEKLFAIIHLFNRGNNLITDNEYIESFVRQAGIIIERKFAEDALLQNEAKLRELIVTKDKFFSIIAHDLRGPFASVVSLSELLAEESGNLSIDEISQFSKSLYKTTSSTFSLLENLLEWSRMQREVMPFNPENINLKSFLNSCDPSTFEMAQKKQIILDVNFPNELTITADPNMLHSIMRNLVTNALKFTNKGGFVYVKAQPYQNNSVLISIKDSGIGMSKETLNNLFRIDTNVSRPGTNGEPSTGLGLILCNEFVEKHGGKIWVESKEGEGSTFYFTTPSSNGIKL
jgi:PAS domain S-box-containing protein